MNDELAMAIAEATTALMAEREEKARQAEARRQECIRDADEQWASLEEDLWGILPEYVHEYLCLNRDPEHPEHTPGDWAVPRLDIPGLSRIKITLIRDGYHWQLRSNRAPFEYQNRFTVEHAWEYEGDEGPYYVRTWGMEGWGSARTLSKTLALALEAGQNQRDAQAEVDQRNQKWRERQAKKQQETEAKEQAKQEETDYLAEAQLSIAEAYRGEEGTTELATAQALISIAESLAYMAANK